MWGAAACIEHANTHGGKHSDSIRVSTEVSIGAVMSTAVSLLVVRFLRKVTRVRYLCSSSRGALCGLESRSRVGDLIGLCGLCVQGRVEGLKL